MASFEPNGADSFESVVAGLTLTLPQDVLPTIQYGNRAVPIDPFSAEIFRDQLLAIYAREVLPEGITDVEQVQLSEAACTHVCQLLVHRMIEGSLGLELKDWVVVRGTGALAVREAGAESSEPFFLDASRAVIGRISGVGYSGYPVVELNNGEPVIDDDGCFEGSMHRGPVLMFEDVTLCDPESGDTTMSPEYDWIIAPLAVKALRFHKPAVDLSKL